MVGAKGVSFLAMSVLVGGLSSIGAARAADDPVGYWATEKHESQINITHCGEDSICGTIHWMREPNDAKGNPRVDSQNEDEVKRKRTLLGLQLINMKEDDDHWKGTVYNPQNGKTYSATLKLLSKNEVEVEGCVAYVLCGGQKWTREEPHQTAASTTTVAPVRSGTTKASAGSEATPAK